MTIASLERALPEGERLLLDTTALAVSQVGWLVTNDRAWARKLTGLESRIRVCTLADHFS